MAQKKIGDLTLRTNFDATCNMPVDDATQTWRVTGAQLKAFIQAQLAPIAPTVQKFTSGSGTYTPTAATVVYIKVTLVGGGGGGAGSGVTGNGGTGGTGGNTTFGTSLLTAAGGTGGTGGSNGYQAGGVATVNSPAIKLKAIQGSSSGGNQYQNIATVDLVGSMGGVSPLGGAGTSNYAAAGNAAIANSGSGGGSAGCGGFANMYSGQGGAAGGYIEAIIVLSAGATYAYTVGASGTAGTAGTSGSAGGAGGSGQIIVEEFYQ